MKKISLCLITIISLFLASCASNDNEESQQTLKNPMDFSNVSSIIGEWESTYEINSDGTLKSKDDTREIVFNSDGTYTYYYGIYKTHGTYTFHNGTATCKEVDGLGYESGTETFKFEPKNEYITTITWQEYDTVIKTNVTKYFLYKKTK